ncbi:hypothetical protein HX837_08025, partial [Marine Group I thaumarchaeote]|nr:hypothetical protein [Marine Group I thaumarchaeote]
MVILFTFWYLLGWQFPTWLWVLSGIFFSLKMRKSIKRIVAGIRGESVKRKSSYPDTSMGLPLSIALGLVYGNLPNGASIIADGQGWTILFILIGSGILAGGVSFNSSTKSKKKSTDIKVSTNLAEESAPGEEGVPGRKLKIKVVKNGKKTVNITLGLNMVRFFGKFVPSKAKTEMSDKGIEFDAIIE